MSKKLTYSISGDCENLTVSYSNGTVLGGKVAWFKFFCDCRMVKLSLGGEVLTLSYDSYVGSEDLQGWKSLFSCENEKRFVDTQWYTHNDDPHPEGCKELIAIDRWFDGETWCYVLSGEVPAEDGSNLIDISNYTLVMPNYGGLPQELKEQTTGKQGIEWSPAAGTYTFQDVLDHFIANQPNFVLPDGSTPDGMISLKVETEYKGLTNSGSTNTGQLVTIQNAGGGSIIASLNGGQSWCDEVKYIDGDCDGAVRNCIALDTEIVTPGDVGLILEAVGVDCDFDDNDVNVQDAPAP